MFVVLFVIKTVNSYVNTDFSNVAKRSYNSDNSNSSVSYLNIDNNPDNRNNNHGSQLNFKISLKRESVYPASWPKIKNDLVSISLTYNEQCYLKSCMKTYNNLFEKICSYENFYIAYENATKGKKHYKEVIEIEKDKDNFLKSLADEVREMKYKVSLYVVFKLWSGGKYRDIYKLPMRDRIVLHAIMVYCERIFRESFILDTFSSIKGRGIHRGLKRLKRAVKDKEYKYVLQLDIHHCYPSIDQLILKQKLRKKFKDERLILLFDTIIDSCDKGVPIGNYTSLYFNNFYFSGMDHWIKEQIHFKYYFRYCDDIVIFGKTKQELHLLFEKIKIFTNKLNVEIKSNYKIFSKELGINFLGYITREKYIRIRKTTKNNFIKKVKKMNIKRLTEKNINVLGSYWGIFKHADCRNLWHKYINNKIFNKNNYGK